MYELKRINASAVVGTDQLCTSLTKALYITEQSNDENKDWK